MANAVQLELLILFDDRTDLLGLVDGILHETVFRTVLEDCDGFLDRGSFFGVVLLGHIIISI